MQPAPSPSTPRALVARAADLITLSRDLESSNLPGARRLVEEASALLAEAEEAGLIDRVNARMRAAELAWSARDFAAAAAHAREGIDSYATLELPERESAARALRANALVLLGDFSSAKVELDAAMALQRAMEHPTATLRTVHLVRIDLALKEGRLADAEAECATLLPLAREVRDFVMEGKCLCGQAEVQAQRGDARASLASLRRVGEIAEETGDAFLSAYARGSQAKVLLDHGEPEDVLRLLGEALEIARAAGAGTSSFASIMLAVAAGAHSQRGEHADARRAAEEAVALSHANGSAHDEAQSLVQLANCLHEAGEMEEAARVARRAAALADESGASRSSLEARLMLAGALVGLGETSEAGSLLDHVLARSVELGLPATESVALVLRASMALAGGHPERALADVERALAFGRGADDLHLVARWELLASQVHEKLGDLASALASAHAHAHSMAELQRRRATHSLEHWRAQHESTFAKLRAERLQREVERSAEQQVRRLLETAPDAMLLVRSDGTLAFTNEEANRLLGVTAERALTLRASELVVLDEREGFGRVLESMFQSPRRQELGVSQELHVLRADSSPCPVEVSVGPFERDGELLMALAFRDVTERRREQAELRQALAELGQLKDRIEAENRYLREELEETLQVGEVVGQSPALVSALHRLQQVAPTDAGVLLLGETGAGKEVFARAVHSMSRRAAHALVKVDCSALPSTLIEAELFGHEKGAFTGAHSVKVGRFELANGSTIFLDEIGELPLDLQSKLLRVVQDQEFERVGSSATRRVDVRLIAATNRDLERMVAEGKFRADLYFRLSVFPVRIPPLRERQQDIELLTWHFIVRKQDKLGKRFERVSPELMATLRGHDWPGNVRELENYVERTMILSPAPVLQLVEAIGTGRPQAAAVPSRVASAERDASHRMKDVERAHVLSVLHACGWKVKGAGNAAEKLDLSPSTLRHRMKQLGIERPGA